MKKISNLLIMALLTIGMGLTSCDEQLDNAVTPYTPGVTPESEVAVTGITLSETTLYKKVGDAAVTLTATVAPDNADDKTLTWSSDNTAVATVADGVVTIVGTGTALITATAKDGSGVEATCTVNVGLLAGKFSVDNGKQVQFSQGNLQATTNDLGATWTWAFAEHQWDYVGNAAANANINGDGTVSVNGTVDLFGWVGASNTTWTGAAIYGISNSTNDADYGTKKGSEGETLKSDWGNTMSTDWSTLTGASTTGWRTLTSDEWTYLLSTRETGGTVFSTEKARYALATINTDGTGVNGIILFPDGVDIADSEVTTAGTVNSTSDFATKCTSAQWTALEAKGCVFLPAAGYRQGTTVYTDGRGLYWSSSPSGSDAKNAYLWDFGSSALHPAYEYFRRYAFSVRLVRPVE